MTSCFWGQVPRYHFVADTVGLQPSSHHVLEGSQRALRILPLRVARDQGVEAGDVGSETRLQPPHPFLKEDGQIPSGKHTNNYVKSQFLMGKLTINGQCSIAMLNYQRVYEYMVYGKMGWDTYDMIGNI